MRIRPCIDLHGGKVKQIVGSTLAADGSAVENFSTDLPPSHFARLYQADRLSGGHVIMLGKGNEAAALDALTAYPGGLQLGGGVRIDTAREYLDAGASHIIISSMLFDHGQFNERALIAMADAIGAERIVVDLSCRRFGDDYIAMTDQWRTKTDLVLTADALSQLSGRCSEFLVHAVDVEGKRGGIDETLVAQLADISPLPVTYAGGVRSLDDLNMIRDAGKGRIDATVGSALDIFGGTLEYRAVVDWQQRNANSGSGASDDGR
ncbi:MAG: phosphoribosylformimino-5-aminoimidazole carboxamide ribotide isomerase [Planctomycetota bacterium]